jgi:hypothetical protein
MVDFAPDVRAILRDAGCYFVRRGRGDHDFGTDPLQKNASRLTQKSNLDIPQTVS